MLGQDFSISANAQAPAHPGRLRIEQDLPVYAFGPFVLDVAERRLTRGSQRRPVTGKTLKILQLLIEAGGRLVTRETFVERLWPNVTVEERNLTVQIFMLRKVLGLPSSPPGYIETVARVGYRLTLPVRRLTPAEETAGSLPIAVGAGIVGVAGWGPRGSIR
jgi:DNA-binding winged helix-turn-helix (wHTH) protein